MTKTFRAGNVNEVFFFFFFFSFFFFFFFLHLNFLSSSFFPYSSLGDPLVPVGDFTPFITTITYSSLNVVEDFTVWCDVSLFSSK